MLFLNRKKKDGPLQFYTELRQRTALPGMLLGLVMVFSGMTGLSQPRTQLDRPTSGPQPTESSDDRVVRMETRTHADGSTYQLRVIEHPKAGPEPIDPFFPAMAVGGGIAMMGLFGSLLLLRGAPREEVEAVDAAAPPPVQPQTDSDSPVWFSDEDVRRVIQEAEDAERS